MTPVSPPRSTQVRFGDFRLDLASGELCNNGHKTLLQDKPLKVLLALLERPGEIVSRDELKKRLWSSDTFVDFDLSLNKAVNRLRDSLNDSADKPLFVETLPRKGYRWIGPAQQVAVSLPPQPDQRPAAKARRPRHWKLLTSLLTLLAVGSGLLFYWSGRQTAPFRRIEISRLTNNGKVITAAISPDGRYVVYATTENSAFIEQQTVGKEALWLRQVASGTDTQIAPPTQVHYGGLTFSRDGNVLYVTQSEGKDRSPGTLYKLPVLGGVKKKIIGDIAVGWWFFGNPVTLSPDGKQLAFLRDSGTLNETELIVANEDGSQQRQLAARKWPNSFEGTVAWSPDGSAIATAVDHSDASGKYAGLVEISVHGEGERSLTTKRWEWIADLVWAPDGRGLIANTAERDAGPTQVEYISRRTGEVRKITGDPNYYHNLSVTADSRVLLTMQFEFSFDAWVAPFSDLDSARPITSHGRGDEPAWSPDGRIVHWSYADGNIWLIAADGSNPVQLTSNGGFDASPRFSPDGRYIVFYSDRSGTPEMWRMDRNGDNPIPLTHTKFLGSIGGFSPDSKWVIYSNRGDASGIWKISIDGGSPTRLNSVEAAALSVSPDGKSIAYSYKNHSASPPERFANPATSIAVMLLPDRAPGKIFQIPNLTSFRWTADGRALIYTKNDAGVDNFWSQPIAGGAPRRLSHFNDQTIDSFDLSRDGKSLVMSRGAARQDVVLIRDLK